MNICNREIVKKDLNAKTPKSSHLIKNKSLGSTLFCFKSFVFGGTVAHYVVAIVHLIQTPFFMHLLMEASPPTFTLLILCDIVANRWLSSESLGSTTFLQ